MALKAILQECSEGKHRECPVTRDPERYSGCDCHCHPRTVDTINSDKGYLIEVASLEGPGIVQIRLNGELVAGYFNVAKGRLFILYDELPAAHPSTER